MLWHACLPTGPLSPWFRKNDLSLLRLAACALVFFLAWELVTRLWRPLVTSAGPLLLPLGQGALYAYSAHVLLLVPAGIITAWGSRMAGTDAGPIAALSVNAIIQLGAVLVVWALTRARFLGRTLSPLGQLPMFRWHPRPDAPALWCPRASLVWVVLGMLVSRLLSG